MCCWAPRFPSAGAGCGWCFAGTAEMDPYSSGGPSLKMFCNCVIVGLQGFRCLLPKASSLGVVGDVVIKWS